MNNFEKIGESLADIFKCNVTENFEYVLRVYTLLILASVFMFGYLHIDWSKSFIRCNNIEVFSMVMHRWKYVLFKWSEFGHFLMEMSIIIFFHIIVK